MSNILIKRCKDLELALDLALDFLIDLEHPRAISDEFVAMAAVRAGGVLCSDEALDIISKMLEGRKDRDLDADRTQRGISARFIDIDEEGRHRHGNE